MSLTWAFALFIPLIGCSKGELEIVSVMVDNDSDTLTSNDKYRAKIYFNTYDFINNGKQNGYPGVVDVIYSYDLDSIEIWERPTHKARIMGDTFYFEFDVERNLEIQDSVVLRWMRYDIKIDIDSRYEGVDTIFAKYNKYYVQY